MTPLRAQLIERREALSRRLEAIHADFRRGLPADSEERAIELQNADTLAEIERVTAEELADVERRIAALNA